MKKPASKNVAASVHQRLLNIARESGRPFNEVLLYFAMERVLYRLSRSRYEESFILKGALLFRGWAVWRLSRQFEFNPETLSEAIRQTLTNRQTKPIPMDELKADLLGIVSATKVVDLGGGEGRNMHCQSNTQTKDALHQK